MSQYIAVGQTPEQARVAVEHAKVQVPLVKKEISRSTGEAKSLFEQALYAYEGAIQGYKNKTLSNKQAFNTIKQADAKSLEAKTARGGAAGGAGPEDDTAPPSFFEKYKVPILIGGAGLVGFLVWRQMRRGA
jgi:hypothetical protein